MILAINRDGDHNLTTRQLVEPTNYCKIEAIFRYPDGRYLRALVDDDRKNLFRRQLLIQKCDQFSSFLRSLMRREILQLDLSALLQGQLPPEQIIIEKIADYDRLLRVDESWIEQERRWAKLDRANQAFEQWMVVVKANELARKQQKKYLKDLKREYAASCNSTSSIAD